MTDVFPRAAVLRAIAMVIAAADIIALAIGIGYGVHRGTGVIDTHFKAGYCLGLVVISCIIVIYATKTDYAASQFAVLGQAILVVLIGAIWRFDHWYLSPLGAIPLVFGIILFIHVVKMLRTFQGQKAPKVTQSKPTVGASTGR